MELKEMIKVMQHFEDGGEVVYRSKDDTFGASQNKKDGNLSWNWEFMDYRIKEPKEKVTIEKWLCLDNQGDYEIIESSNVNKYRLHDKVKFIESYEIEL